MADCKYIYNNLLDLLKEFPTKETSRYYVRELEESKSCDWKIPQGVALRREISDAITPHYDGKTHNRIINFNEDEIDKLICHQSVVHVYSNHRSELRKIVYFDLPIMRITNWLFR